LALEAKVETNLNNGANKIKTYGRIKDENFENNNNEGEESYRDHRYNHSYIIQEHLNENRK
jgi:hypothetical protein